MAANSSLCLTPACISAASHLVWQMAPQWDKMDPCTDFEKMVCYRYQEQNFEDKGIALVIMDQNRRVLREILELPYEEAVHYQSVPWKSTFPINSIDEANFDMLRRAYDTCLDTEAILETDRAPLKGLVSELTSLWPVVPSDTKTTVGKSDYEGLTEAIYYLADLGLYPLLQYEVGANILKDPKETLLQVQGPVPIQVNATALTDTAGLQAYVQKTKTAFTYYLDLSDSVAESLAKGVVDFEVAISTLAGPPVDEDDVTEEMVSFHTLDNLGKFITVFDPKRIFSSLAGPAYKGDNVITESDKYWAAYNKLISNTPKSVVQGWLILLAVKSLGDAVSVDADEERWIHCVDHADALVRNIALRFFVAARFPEAAREQILGMAKGVQSEAMKTFEKLEWMSPEARNRTKQKAANMALNVGYRTANPDIRLPQSLAEYYQTINVTDSYFSNYLHVLRHKNDERFGALGKPTDRGLQPFATAKVNAEYHRGINSINLYASMPQLPTYHHDLPSYATFGGYGAVVGHEIFHAFDNNGVLHDETGLRGIWWDNKTMDEWSNRAQCLVDQYSAMTYPVPGGEEAIDGMATLGENIADAAGLKHTYAAWQTLVKSGKAKVQDLPGLEFLTHEQLFFVFFANQWCHSYREEFNDWKWEKGVHSYDGARIAGATANSRAFREAFKCKVKEPTCEIY
ncbi:hypothetical protein OQA88_8712 [Cercophora sp. LCS_1]